jgi:hypothetical protein
VAARIGLLQRFVASHDQESVEGGTDTLNASDVARPTAAIDARRDENSMRAVWPVQSRHCPHRAYRTTSVCTTLGCWPALMGAFLLRSLRRKGTFGEAGLEQRESRKSAQGVRGRACGRLPNDRVRRQRGLSAAAEQGRHAGR